ncbi:hypothetical protein EJ05DRAFT_477190 [Pseudovirgaria hyperparasitica]|uniref:NADH dehydrogenase [ubiquinone] 1 beta subcomplex subunit 4 n=1 Tax=Pseudovirgaria hyperparasitica TaxID=470096 RepID=A0A6A6W4W7_9PEZI|nr:uncharacterized protein EJ05DRAFT_477190 [Pseudovirgaria hyperparasitica]KAF2756970.1 hypothetical protein EJ05DRAFT_477190 [Pseudovirgaria hyperparasitica]
MDPAMVKYNNMMVNRYKYFRWTPRAAWVSFVYMVAVPTAVGYWFYNTDGKYFIRGKRRGDIISEY